MKGLSLSIALLLLAVGCAGSQPPFDGGEAVQFDAAVEFDAGPVTTVDAGSTVAVFDAGQRPTGPIPGEIAWWQLDLAPGLLAKTGEAAVLIGADGTLVLVDVGNSNHDDEVLAAVRELNTVWLIPARGYQARGPLQVEWVVLTHFHADHIGAFDALASTLTITRGIVHRGLVDVGAGTNASDFAALCTRVTGTHAALNRPLCSASPDSACTLSARAPATSCAGLLKGDLATAADDGDGQPSFIDLGAGARLEFLGANGFAVQGQTTVASNPFGVTDVNEENARSLVAVVRHGPFRMVFAGDLSGSGLPTEPDVESFIAGVQAQTFGTLGVDVIHANHHARKTSSNVTWVNALAPADGRTRSVVAGINSAYLNSPHQETLDAWTLGDRLVDGRFVVTHRASLGGTSSVLDDVNGRVTWQTVERGGGYWLQDRATPSVRR